MLVVVAIVDAEALLAAAVKEVEVSSVLDEASEEIEGVEEVVEEEEEGDRDRACSIKAARNT